MHDTFFMFSALFTILHPYVLREFYSEGALKSEAEVKEGKRHGRYREYYEDGT